MVKGEFMSLFTLLFTLFACIGESGSERRTNARDFVLPNGHEGWVVVEYGVDGAGALPSVGGRTLVRVSPSGQVQISTPYANGILDDRYRFADGSMAPTLSSQRLSRSAEHAATRATPFICCGGTRSHENISAGDPKRWFEYFYVGKGPAGDGPSIP
jgi:hypothetical protein